MCDAERFTILISVHGRKCSWLPLSLSHTLRKLGDTSIVEPPDGACGIDWLLPFIEGCVGEMKNMECV